MSSQPRLFEVPEPQVRRPTRFEAWAEAGKEFRKQHSKLQWNIGDWLAIGHRAYGDSAYDTAEQITGKKRQTLYQFASVAKRVPDCMRHTNLSWEHHQIVASLEPQQQKAWLDVAEEKSLTAKYLRRAVGGKVAPPEPGLKTQVPHDWKFYMVPFHAEYFSSIEALAFSRSIEPGELGAKKIQAPIRVMHQIIVEYLKEHAEEVEKARYAYAKKCLNLKTRAINRPENTGVEKEG